MFIEFSISNIEIYIKKMILISITFFNIKNQLNNSN